MRAVLLGVTLFFGLVVWIFHTLGPATVRAPNFIFKLRGVGVLTWLYALVQMVDMRFYNSRFASDGARSSGFPRASTVGSSDRCSRGSGSLLRSHRGPPLVHRRTRHPCL